MSEHQDDYQKLLDQKRFLGEVEQGIRFANREIIHTRIPEVTKDSILSLAVTVARLRAAFLEAAFALGRGGHGEIPKASEIEALRAKRMAFEEAKQAFEALREAIEKGYVNVSGVTERGA